MDKWNKLATRETVEETVQSLKANGIEAKFVGTSEDAKKEILSLIPKGVEIMNMTSITLDTLSVSKEILESGNYNSVRHQLNNMNRETQGSEMQKLGAGPEWVVGSVHAVTEDGHVLVASNTGSQLPAYASGAAHVIWVVGTQKIVKNTDEGIKRIYEHSLPLEGERAKKAYGAPGSAVNKLLIINKEIRPGRITIIFVNEILGF